MPYKIRRDGGDDKPYCVYNSDTGEKKGCSATEEMAQAHMRALYAAEKKEALGFVDILKGVVAEVIAKVGNIGGDKPRSELDDSDFVFPDERTFPVVTGEDVSDAVSSWGRYKGKHSFEDFKSKLIALCKRKGLTKYLPVAWEVKEAEESAEYERSFNVSKDANGDWRWVAVSSTAFLDRDIEIVSKKSLEQAVALQKEDKGYLTYWHEPALRVGKCDAQFVDGVCLVETGTWFTDEFSEALRKDVAAHPEDWGVSIEFLASLETAEKDVEVNGITVRTVWNDIELGDRSLLPAQRASNVFSRIDAQGGLAGMKEEKLAFLRDKLGDELATKVASTVDKLNEFSTSEDAVTKEASEEPETEEGKETPEVSEPAPTEVEVNPMADPLNQLRVFAASLDEAKQTEIAPIIIELDRVINQETEEEPEPEDETPADSTGYDETANDETAKEVDEAETGKTEEAEAQPPMEQEPNPEVVAKLAEAEAKLAEAVARQAEVDAKLSEVMELKSQMDTLIAEVKEYKADEQRKKEEEVPNLVLSRAAMAPENVVMSGKEVNDIKSRQSEDGVVASIADAIRKAIGGIQ